MTAYIRKKARLGATPHYEAFLPHYHNNSGIIAGNKG